MNNNQSYTKSKVFESILSIPPINLYNINQLYLYFGII
jgi:hypothetical protein